MLRMNKSANYEKNIKNIYRHELKYTLCEAEKTAIISRIKDLISLDNNAINGSYSIRSLYFDDMWNSAYEEKLIGIQSRKKYRIRIYNYSDSNIKLECKQKEGQYIYKNSANLSKEEAQFLISGEFEFLLERPEQLCRQFYIECREKAMVPKAIVDYERIPYIYEPGDVRITFDTNIRTGMLGFDIFDRDMPTLPVLNKEELVMEVKFTEFLPQFIRDILPPDHFEYNAVSKYVLCFEKRYSSMGINEL